jgi:SAM-dependent methyltransferase
MDRSERISIGRNLTHFRNKEKEWDIAWLNRGHEAYNKTFQGLELFFNEVRKLPSKSILDIGAGTLRAVSEFQKENQDLKFYATVLSGHTLKRQPNYYKDLDKFGRLKISPSETLRGIETHSIGGIISVHGIAYSNSPAESVRSIDRVLIPGGILASTFIGSKSRKVNDAGFFIYNINDFLKEFNQLDYDTFMPSDKGHLLFAVKPGPGACRARDLYQGFK